MNAKVKQIAGPAAICLLAWGCAQHPSRELGDALTGLTANQQTQFTSGKTTFRRVFTPQEGLGPLFDANSCAECHEAPVTGGVGDEIEIHASRFIPPGSCDPLFAEGGPVFQTQATPQLQAHGITNDPVPPDATAVGHRSVPPVFGFGLVDAIPDSEILAHETNPSKRGTGIRGHVNRTIDGRIGRFGRKAFTATLFDFVVGAYQAELGITSPFDLAKPTIDGKPCPPDTILGPEPNISSNEVISTTTFVRFLAPPPRQAFTHSQDQALTERGKKLFLKLHCAACHIPEMKTGSSSTKALNYKRVRLFSDLLVHDMGTNLADICLGDAKPSEFRTELLWGLRFRTQFLHDGRAKTVQNAIELHSGEAQPAEAKFRALSDYDKKALLKFLNSI